MAAPTAINVFGTADANNDLVDEPASSSVLDVTEFKFKTSRERVERKNNNGAFRRLEYRNPLLNISLSAFIIGATGLAVAGPGTRVTSLANFAAEKRGFDPSAGTMILEDSEDTLSLTEDQTTSMNILHAPYVVTA